MTKKKRPWLVFVLLGAFLAVICIILFIHDAEYIFTGRTVDLNEVIQNGEELPRDKFVTYQVNICLGAYGETKEYYGFIPIPGKTQQYAILTEGGFILSAEIGSSTKEQELDDLYADLLADREGTPVTITGCLEINSADMDRIMDQYFGAFFESSGVTMTSYAINTTKTRTSQAVLYSLGIFLGAGMIAGGILKRPRTE